eukprot:240605_1
MELVDAPHNHNVDEQVRAEIDSGFKTNEGMRQEDHVIHEKDVEITNTNQRQIVVVLIAVFMAYSVIVSTIALILALNNGSSAFSSPTNSCDCEFESTSFSVAKDTSGFCGLVDQCTQTLHPTTSPSVNPSLSPSTHPLTRTHTKVPSAIPITNPTSNPTKIPSHYPTLEPTSAPSMSPSYSLRSGFAFGQFERRSSWKTQDIFKTMELENNVFSRNIELDSNHSGITFNHPGIYKASVQFRQASVASEWAHWSRVQFRPFDTNVIVGRSVLALTGYGVGLAQSTNGLNTFAFLMDIQNVSAIYILELVRSTTEDSFSLSYIDSLGPFGENANLVVVVEYVGQNLAT